MNSNPNKTTPISNPQRVAAGLIQKAQPLGAVPGVPPSLVQDPNKVTPVRTASGQLFQPFAPINVAGVVALPDIPQRILNYNPNRVSALLRSLNGVAFFLGGPAPRAPGAVAQLGVLVNGFDTIILDTTDEIWASCAVAGGTIIGGAEIISNESQK